MSIQADVNEKELQIRSNSIVIGGADVSSGIRERTHFVIGESGMSMQNANTLPGALIFRNIAFSTEEPIQGFGYNGDIWIQYEE